VIAVGRQVHQGQVERILIVPQRRPQRLRRLGAVKPRHLPVRFAGRFGRCLLGQPHLLAVPVSIIFQIVADRLRFGMFQTRYGIQQSPPVSDERGQFPGQFGTKETVHETQQAL